MVKRTLIIHSLSRYLSVRYIVWWNSILVVLGRMQSLCLLHKKTRATSSCDFIATLPPFSHPLDLWRLSTVVVSTATVLFIITTSKSSHLPSVTCLCFVVYLPFICYLTEKLIMGIRIVVRYEEDLWRARAFLRQQRHCTEDIVRLENLVWRSWGIWEKLDSCYVSVLLL